MELKEWVLALSLTRLPLKEKYEHLERVAQQPAYRHKLSLDEEVVKRAHTLMKQSVNFLTRLDPAYPPWLKEIYQPPIVLYYEGDSRLLRTAGIGMVGSRMMTSYGQQVIDQLLHTYPPCLKTRPIISGLADGIDGYSHVVALNQQIPTIAVVGTGLNHTYPAKHRMLDRMIRQNGLVLSEYPPDTPPKRHHFPMRNRIIAGLCRDLIVVEAKVQSGSLITAHLALQENRNVYAVPGSILSPESAGTNQLIQAGATPLLTWEDLW
ncbi:DNA-processing protein DprA [Atopobacter phocae]|uniref:DNA-processing protein DprA n=1 Tax=Atopobacter phocae TaxID=136492 RepID=UPI00047054EB|nr:DNA-processing protein DprA [Atopobacter phocae]